MARRVFTATAQMSFQGFGIQAEQEPPEWFVDGNGLFAHVAGGVYLRTGVSGMRTPVEIHLCNDRPAVDLEGWEEVAEFSTLFEEETDYVLSVAEDVVPGIPFLNFDGPGDYRCRIHVRGRWDSLWDTDDDDEEPTNKESWKFQFWKEQATPDVFLLDDPRRLTHPR